MDSESLVSQVQRKIELQSPEDLAYLVANVRRAAAARLNEAFPLVDGHEDDLRAQIEALVNDYIAQTFALAAPNLSINGMPASLPADISTASAQQQQQQDPVYEPFDTRKRRRIADLITQEERLLEDVAALKRSVPSRAAGEHAARWREGLARDERDVGERVQAAAGDAEREVAAVDVPPLERQGAVEERWGAAVAGLAGLKREMPAVVARMERARVAGEYVLTEGR